MQKGDATAGRLWYHCQRRHPPTLRHLMKESKPARKLLREWKRIKEEDGTAVDTPSFLKEQRVEAIFDDLGHQAVEKTIELARSRFYWPGMMADVADYCRTCGRCTCLLYTSPSPRDA